MALLTAEEIYIAARHAGFSPDQAVTMTAIALAESSGDTEAHNASGEDSRGLWQINFDAHPQLLDLGDPMNPLVNAKMAFEVSGHGTNITPWTVTHSERHPAIYLDHRDEAERAAYGVEPEAGAHGEWEPPLNYESGAVSAGGPSNLTTSLPGLPNSFQGDGERFIAAIGSQVGHTRMETQSNSDFLRSALAQDGDTYVYGAETDADDVDPSVFDCSELVQWAAAQAGVELTDGSWLQYQHVRNAGSEMSVEEALRTPGALLFRFGSDPTGANRPDGAHVAISLGDGRTIEARGKSYGVGQFDATDRGWTHAGVIPELSEGMMVPMLTDPLDVASLSTTGDSDGDGLLDRIELAIGTDPFNADTDGDGFTDSSEFMDYGTDPRDAQSNLRSDHLRALGIATPAAESQARSEQPARARPAAATAAGSSGARDTQDVSTADDPDEASPEDSRATDPSEPNPDLETSHEADDAIGDETAAVDFDDDASGVDPVVVPVIDLDVIDVDVVGHGSGHVIDLDDVEGIDNAGVSTFPDHEIGSDTTSTSPDSA